MLAWAGKCSADVLSWTGSRKVFDDFYSNFDVFGCKEKDLKSFSEEIGNHVKNLTLSDKEVFSCYVHLPRYMRVKEQWQEWEKGNKESPCQQLVIPSGPYRQRFWDWKAGEKLLYVRKQLQHWLVTLHLFFPRRAFKLCIPSLQTIFCIFSSLPFPLPLPTPIRYRPQRTSLLRVWRDRYPLEVLYLRSSTEASWQKSELLLPA